MNVSVYISSEQIQMIGYEGKAAKRFITHPLPEGAMYNGTIIDRAYMVESLKSINNDNPGFFKGEVKLIVDGSSILSRRISTPKLSQKQLTGLVQDDFADSISSDQIVCGYRQFKAGENAIMGYAMTKEQRDSYVTVFADADIKLSAIRVGTEAVVSFVESRADLQDTTIVINIIDGLTMLSMVFVKGSNYFISRSRLYGDDKSQMLGDILNSLGGLIQFAQSQKFGDLTKSYYIGLSEDSIGLLRTHSPHPEVLMDTLVVYDGPGGTPPPETHFCCLNIQMTAKSVNFLTGYKKAKDESKKSLISPKKLVLLIPVALAVGLAVVSINLLAERSSYDSEMERIQALIDSPETRERQVELGYMRAETALLADVADQEEKKVEWELSRVPGSSWLLDAIIFEHDLDVRISSFSYNESGGTVSVSASCPDSTISNDYVDYLYTLDFVRLVDYTGYGGGGVGFGFSVTIHLIVPEVPEDEEIDDEDLDIDDYTDESEDNDEDADIDEENDDEVE